MSASRTTKREYDNGREGGTDGGGGGGSSSSDSTSLCPHSQRQRKKKITEERVGRAVVLLELVVVSQPNCLPTPMEGGGFS